VICISGKTELELPETRKRMGEKASFVNIYPFIWKDYQENGYVTGNFPISLVLGFISLVPSFYNERAIYSVIVFLLIYIMLMHVFFFSVMSLQLGG
jgi:hypothetical protein